MGQMGHMVLMRAVGDWSLQKRRRVLDGVLLYIYIYLVLFWGKKHMFLELVDMGIVLEMYRQAFFV